jgi:hypothetical protein
MLQSFETNYVFSKKLIHFNTVINIICKIYYKGKNDGFSQVWVINKIYYKQKNDGFSQVWVIYKMYYKEENDDFSQVWVTICFVFMWIVWDSFVHCFDSNLD